MSRSSNNNDAGEGKSEPAKSLRFLRRRRDEEKTNGRRQKKNGCRPSSSPESAYGQVSKKR